MVAPAIQSGLLDLRADGEIPNRFGMEGRDSDGFVVGSRGGSVGEPEFLSVALHRGE